MKCPLCDHKTVIKDSRPVQQGTKRRHGCPQCGNKFNTLEAITTGTGLNSMPWMAYEKGLKDGKNNFVKAVLETMENSKV